MAPSSRESAIRYPLTAILGVDSNLRVLRVLSLHGGMLASNEIIRKSRLAQESLRRALIDLVSLEIVLSSGLGRSSVYRLNANHYFFSVLSELFKAESDRFHVQICILCLALHANLPAEVLDIEFVGNSCGELIDQPTHRVRFPDFEDISNIPFDNRIHVVSVTASASAVL
ncbi:DNA-binding transcriptional ArsR family regulator [Phyllobacterium trifolii]|uniref:DNA-binding transcriptional ArsR family regulator n=1 Tax=Phyllobacterium trifolii TaxID=300193 RepID=A0A839UAW0_9HYPH|nr:DNA-binding transcriptional ArsR family regulator [Phyllobacterium trifolii]